MKTYKIPCTWEMYGILEIEANSLDEAKAIALEDSSPLPDEKNYVDGSFQIDDEDLITYLNPKEK